MKRPVPFACFMLVVMLDLCHGQNPADATRGKFPLPEEIGELKRVDIHTYDEPGLGYSYRYETSSPLKIDFYVYDQDLKGLQDGIDSEQAKFGLESAAAAIRYWEDKGRYSDVEKLDSGKKAIGEEKVEFLYEKYRYRQVDKNGKVGGWRISETYIRIHRGNFLKARVTSFESNRETDEKAIQMFMRAVVKGMK